MYMFVFINGFICLYVACVWMGMYSVLCCMYSLVYVYVYAYMLYMCVHVCLYRCVGGGVCLCTYACYVYICVWGMYVCRYMNVCMSMYMLCLCV